MKALGQQIAEFSPKLKQNVPIWLGIAGICLIFLSSVIPKEEKAVVESGVQQTQAVELEKQLKHLIENIEGVGKVEVMLTLDTESEQIYAKDKTTEQNQSDQNKTSRQESSHVILGSGAGQQPLVETTYMPQVRGVAVVCQGADNITVVSRITDTVSVVLDLPASRICVTKMK